MGDMVAFEAFKAATTKLATSKHILRRKIVVIISEQIASFICDRGFYVRKPSTELGSKIIKTKGLRVTINKESLQCIYKKES